MSFPEYPEYVQAGFQWIGAIPSHWELKPLKFLTECLDGKRIPLNSEQRSFKRGDVPYWGANAIMDHVDEALFDENLVLIGEDGAPFLDPLKSVAFFSTGPVWPNNHIHVLRPDNQQWAKFLVRSLNATDYAMFIEGATRQKLTQSRLMNIPICWPSDKERKKITAFLDHETAKIDALIREQERLIELLQEKRQAVISHAVTKGLDPNVPMRESGVEWLGEVPAHWDVLPTGFRYEIQLGRMLNEDRTRGDHQRPYLRVFDVQWGYINTVDLPKMDFPPQMQKKYRLKPGDLMVNEGGSYVGRSAIWKGEVEECYYQKALHRLRPIDSSADTTNFFLRVMEMATNRGVFVANANQTTIDHLTGEQLRHHRFAFPPLSEQISIADYLDNELAAIHSLEKEADQLISYLQERRTALISAAVTGKIDVRGWQPPADESAFNEEVRQAGLEATA